MKKTLVLIILDGWGIGSRDDTNPIYRANLKTINHFKTFYPLASLQSAGIAVGLPWGEPGNSEVGHLTLGTGQIIYHHYPRISLAIRSGDFFKNSALKKAFEHAKKHQSAVHLLGLLSSGNIHSSYEHLLALLKMASLEKAEKVYFHLFTDGRDSPLRSGKDLVKKFLKELEKVGIGKLASLTGRYYALDRTRNWFNTKRVYDLLTQGVGKKNPDPEKIFDFYYQKGLSDSYVEPTLIISQETESEDLPLIRDNDSLIFFDFREDSTRQIVAPFVLENFSEFERIPLKNLWITTMTQYDKTFPTAVAFPPQKITKSLTSILAENGFKQLKIAETEKYYHLTFFFNGLTDEIFPNEFRILIPSKETPYIDQSPEMRAPEITERLLVALEEGTYDFIAVNYANPDTLAHTGNYQAVIQGLEILDELLGKVYEVSKKLNATLIITSDHGNAEKLYNPLTGEKETQHNINPVPFYLIDERFKLKKERTLQEIIYLEQHTQGVLADVTPTILELMNLPIPKEMVGKSLLKYLI